MRHYKIRIVLCLGLIAAAGVVGTTVQAAIKINGSQLVSSGDGYSPAASLPPASTEGTDGTAAPAFGLVFQFGQPIAGRVSTGGVFKIQRSPAANEPNEIGAGLSYDIARYAFGEFSSQACLVDLTGDVNLSTHITSADIIHLVGFVFKGGDPPQPCEAAGDVNCSGTVTSADVIYLVGTVFKGGPQPCDVCTMIPGTWPCPD